MHLIRPYCTAPAWAVIEAIEFHEKCLQRLIGRASQDHGESRLQPGRLVCCQQGAQLVSDPNVALQSLHEPRDRRPRGQLTHCRVGTEGLCGCRWREVRAEHAGDCLPLGASPAPGAAVLPQREASGRLGGRVYIATLADGPASDAFSLSLPSDDACLKSLSLLPLSLPRRSLHLARQFKWRGPPRYGRCRLRALPPPPS
eukprot:scaffold244126_cov30-Tisochrysis_lutea.AAC.1